MCVWMNAGGKKRKKTSLFQIFPVEIFPAVCPRPDVIKARARCPCPGADSHWPDLRDSHTRTHTHLPALPELDILPAIPLFFFSGVTLACRACGMTCRFHRREEGTGRGGASRSGFSSSLCQTPASPLIKWLLRISEQWDTPASPCVTSLFSGRGVCVCMCLNISLPVTAQDSLHLALIMSHHAPNMMGVCVFCVCYWFTWRPRLVGCQTLILTFFLFFLDRNQL